MNQARQEDEQHAIARRERGPLDLTLEYDQLLTQERVLGHQRDPAFGDIGDRSAR